MIIPVYLLPLFKNQVNREWFVTTIESRKRKTFDK